MMNDNLGCDKMITDTKKMKKFLDVCTKVTNVYNDFYLFKNGYCVSTDIEKPFVVQLDDTQVEYFVEMVGDFKLLHMTDVRKFKKEMDKHFYIVESNTEYGRVLSVLTKHLEVINQCDKWEKFILSPDNDENERILESLFKKNDYFSFKPKSNFDGPDIILTKSLLPLVSPKNYTDLYYSAKKINSDLYVIVFDFQFSLFRVHSVHYYIPMEKY